MVNRIFGLVATAAGFTMIALAHGNEAVLLGAVIVVAVGIGFFVYGSGS
jgi:predicted cobalt transporter CbtA